MTPSIAARETSAMAPFSNMQKKCRDHMYGVPKAKGFDDVTFPSPQPGVPSRRAINVRWTRDVGLQLHMPPAKRRAVPNNATAPAARSMPACHRMGYSSWRTALSCTLPHASRRPPRDWSGQLRRWWHRLPCRHQARCIISSLQYTYTYSFPTRCDRTPCAPSASDGMRYRL